MDNADTQLIDGGTLSPVVKDMQTVEIHETLPAVSKVRATPWPLTIPTTPNPEDAETLVANLVANR